MKIPRYVFSIVTILFAFYGLITKNFEFNYIMIFFMAITILIIGLEEFRKERKAFGWLTIVVFLFSLFVSIQAFLLK